MTRSTCRSTVRTEASADFAGTATPIATARAPMPRLPRSTRAAWPVSQRRRRLKSRSMTRRWVAACSSMRPRRCRERPRPQPVDQRRGDLRRRLGRRDRRDDRQAVAAINSRSTASGVVASKDDNSQLALTAEDGRNIVVRKSSSSSTVRPAPPTRARPSRACSRRRRSDDGTDATDDGVLTRRADLPWRGYDAVEQRCHDQPGAGSIGFSAGSLLGAARWPSRAS